MSASKFNRLIRFVSVAGTTHYGEVPAKQACDESLVGAKVELYDGMSPWDPELKLNGKTVEVKEVLSPLPPGVFIHGVGLNYRKHAEESGNAIPRFPKTFVKYPDAMTGPFADISVHVSAVELDYEGEFCFVMGEDVKNVPKGTNALQYVLGYTIGNDISSRIWQDPKRGPGGQSNYAKSYDGFAPIGPVLVSISVIPDPSKLTLKTHVNGEKRQDSRIDDLIFGVSDIIWYLSQGRTLRKGSVIMTGTPSGVGSFLKDGPKFVQNGDVVEIEISDIGIIKNKFVFEQKIARDC